MFYTQFKYKDFFKWCDIHVFVNQVGTVNNTFAINDFIYRGKVDETSFVIYPISAAYRGDSVFFKGCFSDRENERCNVKVKTCITLQVKIGLLLIGLIPLIPIVGALAIESVFSWVAGLIYFAVLSLWCSILFFTIVSAKRKFHKVMSKFLSVQ